MFVKKKGNTFNYTKKLQVCPVCRKDIRKQKIKRNKMIDSAVKVMVLSRKDAVAVPDEHERWRSR